MNNCTFIGRLGKDPELKMTREGKPVLSFSLAVKRPFSQETDWFDFTAWGHDAQYLAQYAHKGDSIAARGSLRKRRYEGKNNVPMVAWEINCDLVEICGRSKTQESPAEVSTDLSTDQFYQDMLPVAGDDTPF